MQKKVVSQSSAPGRGTFPVIFEDCSGLRRSAEGWDFHHRGTVGVKVSVSDPNINELRVCTAYSIRVRSIQRWNRPMVEPLLLDTGYY